MAFPYPSTHARTLNNNSFIVYLYKYHIFTFRIIQLEAGSFENKKLKTFVNMEENVSFMPKNLILYRKYLTSSLYHQCIEIYRTLNQ